MQKISPIKACSEQKITIVYLTPKRLKQWTKKTRRKSFCSMNRLKHVSWRQLLTPLTSLQTYFTPRGSQWHLSSRNGGGFLRHIFPKTFFLLHRAITFSSSCIDSNQEPCVSQSIASVVTHLSVNVGVKVYRYRDIVNIHIVHRIDAVVMGHCCNWLL